MVNFKLGTIDDYTISLTVDDSFNQCFLRLLNDSGDVVEQLLAEGDPEYRVNTHFNGNTDDWLVGEFIPDCNAALEKHFGKADTPEMGDIMERIKWNFKNNVSLDGKAIKYDKPDG